MFEIYFWILPLSYNSLIYIHGSWQNKMRLNINKKQVSIIQSTNINMNIYVTMLDGSNSCSWRSLKHWRWHSSLIFLVLLFTKPNIEVSGWLYQTKTHFCWSVQSTPGLLCFCMGRVHASNFSSVSLSPDLGEVGHNILGQNWQGCWWVF